MRIALIGDFDTYVVRGLERPAELLPYRSMPGLNLLRGLREIGAADVHIVVVTDEVQKTTVEQGPFGSVHRLPCPVLSGSGSLFLWRRHLILRQLRRIQPSIVHGQGTEREYAFTAVTSSYPNVITVHGIMHRVHRVIRPPLLSLSHVPRWIEKLVVRKARHVICISREVEDFLRQRRSPARCHHIPNAIAPCFFEVEPQRPPEDERVLLFVGTIYPLKGLIHLVEALPAVQKATGKRVGLTIIGRAGGVRAGADYEERVRRRAEELNVSQNLHWAGVLTEREVAQAMAQSDALVLPSFQESAPMCIAEAMAAAVPVVATRVGGIPDLVDDGKTGLLVRPGDTPQLAEAITRILCDTDLQQRMRTAARQKAAEQYAPRVVAQQTLQVYETIVK